MRKTLPLLTLILTVLGLLFAGCNNVPSADQTNNQARDKLMNRATTQVPVPDVHNFIARKNLAEYMRRMDNPSKVWYVYLLGDNGNIIGYHVGTYPQSVCTFMTPPKKEQDAYNGSVVVPAPGLDGVYYGSGGCNSSFMFDESTGAMVLIGGLKFLAYDQPLDIKAQPLTFQSVPAKKAPAISNDAPAPTGP